MTNDSDSDDKLYLDVDSGDYARELGLNELWQKDAYNKVCELLKDGVNEIEKHEERTKKSKDINENKVHMHDAIFISGARGTGKTAFLHNIEGYWN